MNGERYFGLHFDFHAGNEKQIGIRTEKEDIKEYIRQAKPDFIQCDCKGHGGYSSYPTKVGTPAAHIVCDNLKIWCEAAHESGIPIYVHYSGIIDNAYMEKHPEDESRPDPDNPGNEWFTNFRCASVFGKYADKLLIPQLKELIDNYSIDGVWVDGDCWAVKRDYSQNAKPYLKDNITTEEHNEVMRQGFFKYLSHYVKELHKYKPDFKVIDNWAYSSYMPEKPEINVDSLSGDYPSNDSVHSARFEGRCICGRGLPWDLMGWGFEMDSRADKPAIQLMQEAAMVVALGGGFQVYIMQNSDGSPRNTASKRLKPLGEFMQKRRDINFGKKTKAQTAVFYSAVSRNRKANIFNSAGATNNIIGMLNCVLDSQYTADVIFDYQLDLLYSYPIVIVPEWEEMGTYAQDALLKYVQDGGNLVLSGAQTCMRFAELSDIKLTMTEPLRAAITGNDGGFSYIAKSEPVLCLEGGKGDLYTSLDLRDRLGDGYKRVRVGAGSITFIPFSLGKSYFEQSSYIFKEYLYKLLVDLCAPVIEVDKPDIDITMQEDEKALLVNLINMAQGRHSLNTVVYDYVPPIDNVTVTVRGKYTAVSVPTGEEFSCEILPDCVLIHLKNIEIHSVIRLERE